MLEGRGDSHLSIKLTVVSKFGIDRRGNCPDFRKLPVLKCTTKPDYGKEAIFGFVMAPDQK